MNNPNEKAAQPDIMELLSVAIKAVDAASEATDKVKQPTVAQKIAYRDINDALVTLRHARHTLRTNP